MKKDQLSERARTFLEGRHFAVLATTNDDGSIHQSVMWYLLEKTEDGRDMIVMNTATGRIKERNMYLNPRISLCVENEYSYITITGDVELIVDRPTALADIYRLACRYDGQESALQQMFEQFSAEQRITLHLKVLQVTEYFSQ
jgi:PPOX class probable F420-dependent enzyme